MTRDDIIRMAREADVWVAGQEPYQTQLERFAALVAKHTLANIDPSSFMSWQEGYEAGRLAEREACAELCERMARRTQDIRRAALEMAAENIRARGEK